MQKTTSKLGIAIKTAHKEKGLTQMELSEELGITPRYLQAIENENRTPSYDLFFRILSYLDIPLDNIFHTSESNTTPEQAQLLYLIQYKCTEGDISVLLSTAKALVETKG